jgi:mannosyltransferase
MQMPAETEASPRGLSYLVMIAVSCATYLSFHRLGSSAFWLDEVISLLIAGLPWSRLAGAVYQDPNMSLYYVLLKVWVACWGDGEAAARSLSGVCAAGGVIATYAVGKRLYDTRTGLTAAFVIAVNAFFIQYAQEARGYTLFLLLAALSMYLFIGVIERPHPTRDVALGSVNALMLYAHLFGAFIVFSQAVSLAFLPTDRIRWRNLLRCVSVTAGLALPLAILVAVWMSRMAGSGSWAPGPSWRAIQSLVTNLATGREVGGYLLLTYLVPGGLSLVIAARALVGSGRSFVLWRRALPVCWLVVPALCVSLASLLVPAFVNRYLFATLPALVLLTSAGLSSFRPKGLYVVGVSLLAVLSIDALYADYYPRKKEDFRLATQFVVQNAKPGDAILFYSEVAIIPFEYYYQRSHGLNEALVPVYPRPFGSPDWALTRLSRPDPSDAELESMAQKHDRLWVVLAHDMNPGLGWDSGKLLQRIGKPYSKRNDNAFEGVRVLLYEVRPR